MGCSLKRFFRTFPCSILTPLLAAQFFHADLGHIPFHISTARQQFYACLIWKNKPRFFHAGVALSRFRSQANPYKYIFISDQTSEYLHCTNLGLVKETNPRLRNTTSVPLTFLFYILSNMLTHVPTQVFAMSIPTEKIEMFQDSL